VARLETVWDTVFPAHYRQIVGRDDLYLEPVVAQVIGIALAALAFRVLVERDVAAIGDGLGVGEKRPVTPPIAAVPPTAPATLIRTVRRLRKDAFMMVIPSVSTGV